MLSPQGRLATVTHSEPLPSATSRSALRNPWRATARLGLVTALLFAVLGTVEHTAAHAQVVADPDFWKQTAERQDIVNRFVYSQSPQPIPSTYDHVLESETILRQRQASLPPSNPKVPSVWQQIRSITVKSAVSTAPRALGTLNLVAGTGWLGWKIGSGPLAKFLKIGWPDPGGTVSNEQLVFRSEGQSIYPGYGATLEMPFDGWLWTYYAANATRSFWFHGAPPSCVSAVLIDPQRPEGLVDFDAGQLYCKADGFAGNPSEPRVSGLVTASAMPEHALTALGAIEDYTNQPYTRSTPTPPAPPQTTVEQAIENELARPESGLLRQWLNYQLGSPGETDPLEIGPPNAGIEFPNFREKWEEHSEEFPDYGDPWEYWQGAVDIIERGDRSPAGGEGVLKCERSDGSFVYWDLEEATFVVVRDGKIETYFKPDDADAYWLEECPGG